MLKEETDELCWSILNRNNWTMFNVLNILSHTFHIRSTFVLLHVVLHMSNYFRIKFLGLNMVKNTFTCFSHIVVKCYSYINGLFCDVASVNIPCCLWAVLFLSLIQVVLACNSKHQLCFLFIWHTSVQSKSQWLT